MIKTVLTMIVIVCMMVGSSMVYAASIKCQVEGIIVVPADEKTIVELRCEDIKTLKAGDTIKVSLPRKEAAVEGC